MVAMEWTRSLFPFGRHSEPELHLVSRTYREPCISDVSARAHLGQMYGIEGRWSRAQVDSAKRQRAYTKELRTLGKRHHNLSCVGHRYVQRPPPFLQEVVGVGGVVFLAIVTVGSARMRRYVCAMEASEYQIPTLWRGEQTCGWVYSWKPRLPCLSVRTASDAQNSLL